MAVGAPIRNSATASGRTVPAAWSGKASVRVAPSMAGSEASEDCVLSATDCAGNTARTNADSDVRARTATARTNAKVKTIAPIARTATYHASTAPTARPPRAVTSNASANTPTGATHSTQPMITSSASATPLKNSPISAARLPSMRRSASAKNRAKTTTGTTAPCAAEAMGLAGTSARKLCSRGGRSGILALPVRSAASPVTVQLLNSAEPSATPNTAEANRSTMNTTSARRATPVAPPAPSPVPMPTTISAKTSGMIAIRRPSSQMPPAACKTGSTAACGPEA